MLPGLLFPALPWNPHRCCWSLSLLSELLPQCLWPASRTSLPDLGKWRPLGQLLASTCGVAGTQWQVHSRDSQTEGLSVLAGCTSSLGDMGQAGPHQLSPRRSRRGELTIQGSRPGNCGETLLPQYLRLELGQRGDSLSNAAAFTSSLS